MKTLRNKAARLLQELIRKLNPYCIVCGKPEQAGHHHYPKSISNRLRYELKNIIPLCNGCHFSHHNGNPEISRIYRQRMGGQKWEDELAEMRKEMVKVNKQFYLDAIEKLNALNKI